MSRQHRTESEREVLRKVWNLSMHGQCPIWLGGAMQHIVTEALGVDSAVQVNEALGQETIVLDPDEVAEIRDREARIRAGDYDVL
jgi:hypothetical protein